MEPPRSVKEALIALGLIAFGLICLPGMIYFVGTQVIGEYELGILGFYEAMADSLADGSGAAWLLVLSPYLVVQLWRAGNWLRQQRRGVN